MAGGTASRAAPPVMSSVPTSALPMPAPSSPYGLQGEVRKSADRTPKPRAHTVHSTQAMQPMASTMEMSDSRPSRALQALRK